MASILLDTNVILDLLLERSPHADFVKTLITFTEDQDIAMFMTASSITDIFYICKKAKGDALARQFIVDLLGLINVLAVDEQTVKEALSLAIPDFEDAIQAAAAKQHQIELILTRNLGDFQHSPVPILSPQAYLAQHNS